MARVVYGVINRSSVSLLWHEILICVISPILLVGYVKFCLTVIEVGTNLIIRFDQIIGGSYDNQKSGQSYKRYVQVQEFLLI